MSTFFFFPTSSLLPVSVRVEQVLEQTCLSFQFQAKSYFIIIYNLCLSVFVYIYLSLSLSIYLSPSIFPTLTLSSLPTLFSLFLSSF